MKNLHNFLTKINLSIFLLLQNTLFINYTKTNKIFYLFKYIFTLIIQKNKK